MMIIKTLVVGPLETNSYILSCPKTKEAVVVDPGDESHLVLNYLKQEQLKVKYILNTHGHWDHVAENDVIRQATGALVAIHNDDQELILNPEKVGSPFHQNLQGLKPADMLLRNHDQITFGEYTLEVIYTPGHTKGGCCFYEPEEKVCFSGDTLFKGTIGRTDLYGGSYAELVNSVKKRLAHLADETEVYPGHGPSTTMKIERKVNPYVK